MITPYAPFPADPLWLPSIIIGWQKNMTIACPPHGTLFTGTGLGYCYGALVDGQLMSVDLITGKPAPVADILPNHDQFTIFANQDYGGQAHKRGAFSLPLLRSGHPERPVAHSR